MNALVETDIMSLVEELRRLSKLADAALEREDRALHECHAAGTARQAANAAFHEASKALHKAITSR